MERGPEGDDARMISVGRSQADAMLGQDVLEAAIQRAMMRRETTCEIPVPDHETVRIVAEFDEKGGDLTLRVEGPEAELNQALQKGRS